MGTQGWLTLQCPYCDSICGDICCTMCDSIIWRCECCDEEFNVAEQFNVAGYVDEAEKDSKIIEDLGASFQEPFAPMPVISQLAIAIEETLIVYHEPHFIRWACRALQGLVDKKFSPTEHMDEMSRKWGMAGSWAEIAAKMCVSAARQPTPDGLIDEAAIAIEAALTAQDVMARKDSKCESCDNVDCANAQKEKSI